MRFRNIQRLGGWRRLYQVVADEVGRHSSELGAQEMSRDRSWRISVT
jgi:hypothetical protein